MKTTPLLVGSVTLLAPAVASARTCEKICLDNHGDVAQIYGEWFAEMYAVTDKGTVFATASLSIDSQTQRRFEGELCVARGEHTHCESFSGTVSGSGEVTLVGTGPGGFDAHFDVDDAAESMSGKVSFRAPGEWFAEAFASSPKEWFAEVY